MSLVDPISDMLTRIRNAQSAGHEMVDVPCSRMKTEITRLLKREGYVSDYVVEGENRRKLRVYLKYDASRAPVIRGLRRASRPGRRLYTAARDVPRVLGGMGTVILSTSQGVMTGKEAKQRNLGGEILCTVW
ncbi:MAG: 30S ribosomal protein S8 [Lentisphaerae bacterium]|nr:30S ribosomal protein S8 [Lentisphaerota bacterium]